MKPPPPRFPASGKVTARRKRRGDRGVDRVSPFDQDLAPGIRRVPFRATTTCLENDSESARAGRMRDVRATTATISITVPVDPPILLVIDRAQ